MKTIKIFFLGLLVWGMGYECKAQLSVGIQGGVSTGSAAIDHIGDSFLNTIEGKNIMGYEAGLYAKLKLGPLFIRPSALYEYRQGQVTYYNNGSQFNNNFSLHKIQVPVIFGLHLIGPLGIEAGPQYNYLMAVTDSYGDYSVNMGKNGLGYRVGAVLDFKPVFFNVSYQGVTTYNDGNNARFREPYALVFGVGLRLFGGGDDD